MTKKFLSFMVAGTLIAAPALSFAEITEDDSSSSSQSSETSSVSSGSSSSSVSSTISSSSSTSSTSSSNARPCEGKKGRDMAACQRLRSLSRRAQRTHSKLQDRKGKHENKNDDNANKKHNALRKLLRREVEAVTEACGSKKGLERIQCIKDMRNNQ